MHNSTSSQEPFPNPPPDHGDAAAWGRWAVEFLDHLCRIWAEWRRTWTKQKTPIYQTGNPDAYFILDRETRIVGYPRSWATGPPPPELSRAPRLLDELSGAVQRFSAQSEWQFEPVRLADEVSEELLQVAQKIESAHYQKISQAQLEKLSRLMRMAIRRRPSAAGDINDQSSAKGKRAGGRPPVSEREAEKRRQLVERWNRARAEGVRQKDFCADEGISLKHLKRCINWLAQRLRRNNKP